MAKFHKEKTIEKTACKYSRTVFRQKFYQTYFFRKLKLCHLCMGCEKSFFLEEMTQNERIV